MKKAQGLSINTIIVAIIALLVLMILAFILVRNFGIFGENTRSCSVKNGVCDTTCDSGEIPDPTAQCPDQQDQCCIPIFEEDSILPNNARPISGSGEAGSAGIRAQSEPQ